MQDPRQDINLSNKQEGEMRSFKLPSKPFSLLLTEGYEVWSNKV